MPRTLLLVIVLLFAAPAGAITPPPLPDGAVFTVDVTLDKRARSAGHGFVVQRPDGPVLITALHLLGAGEAPAHEVGVPIAVTASEAWSHKRSFVATLPVVAPHASPDEPATDVALFSLPKKKNGLVKSRAPIRPLVLASGCPRDGETVWLATAAAGDMRARIGTVKHCDERSLEFELARALDLGPSAGAPLLDSQGYVVSMLATGEGRHKLAAGPSPAALSAHLSGGALAEAAEPRAEADAPASSPEAGTDPWRNTAGIDLRRLHTELLPAWGLYGTDEDAILAVLRADEELLATFQEISRLSWANTMGNFRAISRLIESFEHRLGALGSPLSLRPFASGQQLAILTSWRLYRGPVRVGAEEVGVELAVRLEGLNVVEALMAFGVDRSVLISPASALDAAEQAVLPALRSGPRASALGAELTDALGESTVASLQSDEPEAGALARLVGHVATLAARAGARAQVRGEDVAPSVWLALAGEAPQLGAALVCWHGEQGYRGAAAAGESLSLCGSASDRGAAARERFGEWREVDLGLFPQRVPLDRIRAMRPARR